MWFKNLTFMRYDGALPESGELLQEMQRRTLSECGPLEAFSAGFVPPFGDEGMLLHSLAGYDLLALGTDKRLLPPAVLKSHVAMKVREIEAESGRPPGKRRRRELAEQAMIELLPQAFIVHSSTHAYIDRANRLLVVDTASDTAAGAVAHELREALGTFPAIPLIAENCPRTLMTAWVRGDAELPEHWQLGEDCELRDPVDTHTVVGARGYDLERDEIAEHLNAGMQVTRLAIVFDDRISFTLDDRLKVRKLKFLDLVLERLDSDRDSAAAEMDARFALMTLELARLIGSIERVFECEKS